MEALNRLKQLAVETKMGYVRKIHVELVGATGLKNSEYLGKSDPYVILSIGTTEFRSKVAEDQATAPVWNEKFVIPALESDTELLIRILNENTMATDDELGRVVIPLAQYRHGETASSFTLHCHGKPQGELKMNLAFESDDDHESKGLAEKIQDLVVGEKTEHHEDATVEEQVEEKIEEQKEDSAQEKKEESEEKVEEKKEVIEEKAEEEEKKKHKHKHKHKHHHHHHKKHHKKSDDEASSSSSDSESDKEGKDK